MITMGYFKAGRCTRARVLVAASLVVASGAAGMPSASGKSNAVEVLKYFNPMPQKNYLNQSQDRLIKKKSFKAAQTPNLKPAINNESGFFAIIEPAKITDLAYLEQVLSRDDVNGISALLTWRQLEPVEGEGNWKIIDDLLESCKKHDKSAILRVSTCGVDLPGGDESQPALNSDCPKWVFDSGIKSVEYTGADGKKHLMPVFWDSTYLASWGNLIKELGRRYDKNPYIHSIGITGGGVAGGTQVIPNFVKGPDGKTAYTQLEQILKKDHGMSQRQLVQHWKYVADLFPKAFPTARLNFAINPTTPNRAGQDALDEITDYLIYRYGARVFLTRQNVQDGKHGFDEYRLHLKFKPDTYSGVQLSSTFKAEEMEKLCKAVLDDGITFAEIPPEMLSSTDELVQKPLATLRAHIGYQLVSQEVKLPEKVVAGEAVKAAFAFVNLGAASPKRPDRQFDKDIVGSYKIQLEFRDAEGKPLVQSLHTPEVKTSEWSAGNPVSWEKDLRMPKMSPGTYSVWLSLIDVDTKRKLKFIDALSGKEPNVVTDAPLGNIQVLPESASIGASTPEKEM